MGTSIIKDKAWLHRLAIGFMVAIVVSALFFLLINGYSYYSTSIEQRNFHNDHSLLKPSGNIGHGLGILGAFFIVAGVFSYMARKRIKLFARLGILKYWLEFHIFLCSLGPVLILYHTAFKFGGLIAIGFWCMVAVVASGIVGRFIYLQIPRTIEGREMTLKELELILAETKENIRRNYPLNESLFQLMDELLEKKYPAAVRFWLSNLIDEKRSLKKLMAEIKHHNLQGLEKRKAIELIKRVLTLNRRIRRLSTMHRHFRNWHVVHLPIALVMLVIMLIHIGVAIYFGYNWIL